MSLSIMVKPASSACNLRCEYCFYTAVAKKREVFDKGMLSLETSEKMISSAFELMPDHLSLRYQMDAVSGISRSKLSVTS